MYAYIDRNTKNWLNREVIYHGVSDIGHTPILTDTDDPSIDDEGIYYGNTGFSRRVLTTFDYPVAPIAHVPYPLMEYAGRTVEEMTLADALKRGRNEKVFIKPIPSNHKRFTGLVLSETHSLLNLAEYGDDELVLLSPFVNIVSEWRCFVRRKAIIGSRLYHGDFRIAPDYSIVEKWPFKWKDSPVAYSLDIGITDKNEMIIVECNDVLSLGWYGFTPPLAAQMVTDRWDEIHSTYRKS